MYYRREQQEICNRYGTDLVVPDQNSIIGISKDFDKNNFPINGLRHLEEKNTNGWYIWSGNVLSRDRDFFIPLHVGHLEGMAPEIIKYLGLPPGWRFLIGENNYEDVWEDLLLKYAHTL